MDRIGADFNNTVSQIADKFKTIPLPIQLPLGAESDFRGVIDLVSMKQIFWLDETLGAEFGVGEIDPDLMPAANEAREDLVAKLGEFDDELMERYLGGEEITAAQLIPVIRRLTLALKAVPVLCGSALEKQGRAAAFRRNCRFSPLAARCSGNRGRQPPDRRRRAAQAR